MSQNIRTKLKTFKIKTLSLLFILLNKVFGVEDTQEAYSFCSPFSIVMLGDKAGQEWFTCLRTPDNKAMSVAALGKVLRAFYHDIAAQASVLDKKEKENEQTKES